jgi:hypothetical protein
VETNDKFHIYDIPDELKIVVMEGNR